MTTREQFDRDWRHVESTNPAAVTDICNKECKAMEYQFAHRPTYEQLSEFYLVPRKERPIDRSSGRVNNV